MYSLNPRENASQWPRVAYSNFDMLIAGEPPAAMQGDWLEPLISYSAMLLFTVFFLNIFIGVIGSNYERQKAHSAEIVQSVRTGICLTFLLRAKLIPCRLCSPRCALAGCLAAMALAMAVQFAGLARSEASWLQRWYLPLFCLCQAVMVLAAYQDEESAWGPRTSGSGGDRYLWLAVACEPPEDELGGAEGDADEESASTERAGVSVPMDSISTRFGVLVSISLRSSGPQTHPGPASCTWRRVCAIVSVSIGSITFRFRSGHPLPLAIEAQPARDGAWRMGGGSLVRTRLDKNHPCSRAILHSRRSPIFCVG